MTNGGGLILEKALKDLDAIQLRYLTWKRAEEARCEIALVIRRLWRHYEASQAALTMALAELRQARGLGVKSAPGDTLGE